jgi:uncharacterized protein
MVIPQQPPSSSPDTLPSGGVTVERLRALRAQIMDIAAGHHVTNVRVIGSVARHESDEFSDVDLIVDIDPNGHLSGLYYFSELQRFREDVAALLGCEVDVLDAGTVEMHTQQSEFRKRFADRVMHDAIAL